ncbi:MAG: hypothetical protein FWC96_06685, partial [Oscillospiraceae bacterium]|nr:hypothetical protein [Oscillospiraceae bacterium]
MMKRTLALLLACILVLGQIPLISASALTAGERPPIDIPATITNIPTGYTVEPGTANTVDWSGVWDTLRPGQIWTDTSVYYPQTGGYYDGTAIITIYIWAKQFEKENGELGLLGDDSNITVETRMGHFSLYAVDYPLSTDDAVFYPPSAASDNEHITGVDFSRTDDRMRWSIDESHIIDEEAPFAIRYYLYLAPRDTWMIRFAYTTLGSELVVRFEPANDNPEYWTTVWVLYEAFSLQNVSWNNGNGMNSGFVTDNDLGITFQLGSNANGSYQNQTAESVSWSASNLANRVHWANNARNIATGQLYWWHLYWYSGSGTRNFVITIKDAYTDIDGNTQDRSYHIGVPGGGGNTSIPGDLVLSSEVPFRIPFPPDSPYRWDGDTGYLIFEAPLHAEIVLTDELWDTLQPKGNVIIEKQFPDFDFR